MPPDTVLAVLPRVRLRPMGEADIPSLFAMYSSDDVTRYLPRPRMTDVAEAAQMLSRIEAGYADGTNLQLAIERNSDGAFLGVCLLFNIMPGRVRTNPSSFAPRAEFGYALRREYWGQGYLAEALPALVDHAFGALDLSRLEADVDPRNAPSARVLERLGFRREGLMRERMIVRGELTDSAIYGLLRSEWRAMR